MKLFKMDRGIIIENKDQYFLLEGEDWDSYVNDDNLYLKLENTTKNLAPVAEGREMLQTKIKAPIQGQEIWACGVTYLRSKVGRQEESKNAGGSDFYARVYEADRPEIFFKGTAYRTVGPGGKVSIRKDSSWDVPEPELTLMITTSGKIVGYTIGNDMSSRSIEGENPMYLPQAKIYDGSAALGPCIYIPEKPLAKDTLIEMQILREGSIAFEGKIAIDQIKRKFEDLVSYLYRELSFPCGCLLMTGTGIVPSSDFTLKKDDEIRITIEPIGTLINTVK